MQILNYFIFALVLFYVSMWLPINLFLSSLGKKKKVITLIQDKKISAALLEKTDIKINSIKISESSLLFGAMVGIPGRPQLILSRKLYDTFGWNELEYVILHEAGHYKLGHSVRELVEGITFFVIGFFILVKFPSLILGVVLGIIFGILMIQLAKIDEVEADNFSLNRIGDPRGMITATEKFRGAWKSRDPNRFLRLIFYRGNPYENRIRMAKGKI